jgi:hypothetical protein
MSIVIRKVIRDFVELKVNLLQDGDVRPQGHFQDG